MLAILVIIFWAFLLFWHRFQSSQVKRNMVYTMTAPLILNICRTFFYSWLQASKYWLGGFPVAFRIGMEALIWNLIIAIVTEINHLVGGVQKESPRGVL